MRNSTFLLISLLLASGSVFAHEGRAAAQLAPAAKADAFAAPPSPIAARFDLKVNKVKTDWYLWREANSVETADLASGQNSIWERAGADDYNHQRIFHKDRRIVEYTPGEIRTRHAEPDWSKLSSVVSPQLLLSLKRGASKQLFGQKAVQYSGKIKGQAVRLWWLAQAQLPAQLEVRSGAQNLAMTLKELHVQAPAAWPRATEDRIAAYARMDAADFGDMENDPFVARVMQMDGHTHMH